MWIRGKHESHSCKHRELNLSSKKMNDLTMELGALGVGDMIIYTVRQYQFYHLYYGSYFFQTSLGV